MYLQLLTKCEFNLSTFRKFSFYDYIEVYIIEKI